MLRSGNFRRRFFDPAARAAGLEDLSPHDLRHTAASLLVASGANVKAVQRMLGHASAAMTLDVYSGLFDDDLGALAERMDAAHDALKSPRTLGTVGHGAQLSRAQARQQVPDLRLCRRRGWGSNPQPRDYETPQSSFFPSMISHNQRSELRVYRWRRLAKWAEIGPLVGAVWARMEGSAVPVPRSGMRVLSRQRTSGLASSARPRGLGARPELKPVIEPRRRAASVQMRGLRLTRAGGGGALPPPVARPGQQEASGSWLRCKPSRRQRRQPLVVLLLVDLAAGEPVREHLLRRRPRRMGGPSGGTVH
ncbi:MAG: integrase family protein [Modestobacter sp.]|nr:integrase family protein [Modestobacter sp.]